MERERDSETTIHRPDEVRGGGGKLRRPPARKPPSTPYARPPSRAVGEERRRWLSKLVDPARRLISGGASILFPSLFSNPPDLEDCDDNQETETEVEHDASVDDQNCTVNHEISRIIGVEGPSTAVDVSETVSDLVCQEQETKHDTPDEKGLSDIELLLKGKSFSRDEVNRLMNIINSRAVEVPNTEQEKKYHSITVGEPKAPVSVTSHERIDITSEKKQRDPQPQGLLWKASTPLHQSAILDEIAASPIDIAKAYMGSRRESGNFSAMIPKDERSLLFSPDFGSKPTIPSPSPYWPGSMVQDQRDYLTPQPQRGRYGVHNFPRTPYSRTIFSKSKSKVTPPLQGDADKWLRPSSMQKSRTPVFGQEKSRNEQSEDDYASVGPIRRSRHKLGSHTPFNSPNLIVGSSSVGPSKIDLSRFSQGFLPAVKNTFEPGASSSGGSQFRSADRKDRSFEVGAPTVHPQTSRIARSILDHLDRNPPTPKDKLEELKLATAWNKSSSSTAPSLEPNSLQKSARESAHKSISLFGAPSQENLVKKSLDTPRSDVFLSNGRDAIPQTKSSNEAPNLRKKPPTSGTKPVLSSILVDKPVSNWKFSSDQVSSSGFTFPVSTNSSEAVSEPPTPSIMPSSGQKQPKDGLDVHTYTFGSAKSEPALVFTFPSTSNSGVQNDNSEIKFAFGSDKPRLSFSTSVGKDAICY